MPATPHVALLIETSREYARGLLRGVARYQQEHRPWSIYFEPHGLDAFVLNLNGGLSDAALDDLFALVAGDYNGDGMVDAADYPVWRDSLGQSAAHLPADGDQSGTIDLADYQIWKSNLAPPARLAALNPVTQSVPEPSAMALLCALLSLAIGGRCAHRAASPTPPDIPNHHSPRVRKDFP